MKLKALLMIAYRNVWRNPKRSVLTLLAIALGIWSSVTLSSIARGLSHGMKKNAINNLTGHIQIHAKGYLDDQAVDNSFKLSHSLKVTLNTALTERWTPRIRVPGVVMSERESAGIVFVGIDPEREKGLSFIGDGVSKGKFLSGTDDTGLIVGEKLLKLLETGVGKRVVVISRDTSGNIADRGFRIKGAFKAKLESTEKLFIFTGLKTAQTLLATGSLISEISLSASDADNLEPELRDLRRAAPNLEVKPWTELKPLVSAILKLQQNFLYLWFVIVVVAISIGLINTLFMALFERTREIGLMQALGMNTRGIIAQILFESFMLLVIGAASGNLLSLASVKVLSNGIDISRFAAGAQHIGFSNIIYPVIVVRDWGMANALIFGLCMLSSLYPAWKASRLLPAEALRKA